MIRSNDCNEALMGVHPATNWAKSLFILEIIVLINWILCLITLPSLFSVLNVSPIPRFSLKDLSHHDIMSLSSWNSRQKYSIQLKNMKNIKFICLVEIWTTVLYYANPSFFHYTVNVIWKLLWHAEYSCSWLICFYFVKFLFSFCTRQRHYSINNA